MDSNSKRCFRCQGRKKMFKLGGAYSLVDTGGIEVTCPLCNGEGMISIPKVVKRRKTAAKKTKDVSDARREETKE